MIPRIRHRLPPALLLPPLLLLAACSKQPAQQGRPPQGPVPVTVAETTLRDVPVSIRGVGTVEGSNTVSIRARVGGELMRVAFTEGQDVRRGDVLFVIDRRPYEAALEAAEAALARDRARAASAAAEAGRYADLVGREYVTKQQYDDARANAEAAAATARADSAAVESARLDLDYCTIRAPISGRTGNVPVKQGNLVKANGDDPLVVIQQMTPALVRFTVPERSLSDIRRHAAEAPLRVRAILPADTSRAFEGVLAFLDNAVDENTGTILLKASFPNEDTALWPGQFVDVFLDLAIREGAIVVPARATQEGQQGTFVWVVKADSTADTRPVVLGPRADDIVVVEQGLQAGETVVTDGQLRLTPGSKVNVKPGPSTGGPSR